MRAAKTRSCRIAITSMQALSLLWCAPAALAEGGFPEPGLVVQSQGNGTANYAARGGAASGESVTITASGDGYNLTETTGAAADAGHLSTGVGVWDTATVHTAVDSNVTLNSSSLTFTWDKGGNSLSFGESATEATVVINGKIYVVAKEVAAALARSTQFGASTAAEADGTLAVLGNGYSSTPFAPSKSSR